MSNVPDQNVSDVMALYPSDPREGSPFNTSFLNAITPQYKRSAALQGDVVFQAPRRFFVQQRSGNQPVWVYRMLDRYLHFQVVYMLNFLFWKRITEGCIHLLSEQ
jgi:hypothetical protein